MRKLVYQAIGFVVWRGLRALLKDRFGPAPRRLAVGGVAIGVIAALVLAGRRAASE